MSFPRLSPVATLDAQIFSSFVAVTLDSTEIRERDSPCRHFCRVSAPLTEISSANDNAIAQRQTLGPSHLAGRRNEIVVNTAKQLLSALNLFESLFNPGK
jgi:hypothetical protein